MAAKEDQSDSPTQELRDQLAAAIKANDIATAEQLLVDQPPLANVDLRATEARNDFSDGHPLHLACEHNHDQLAELLLKHGAHADAPGRNPGNRPAHGMPLHFAAAVHRNYPLANALLNHGATPNSYPNCDQATIERMFYQAREAGMSDAIVRRAYAKYLPNQSELESQTVSDLVGDAPDQIKLFARMVDFGGQPPFAAVLREGFDDLLIEIVDHSQNKDGTPHDHPNSSVIDNISGAARWYGYPRMVRRLMNHSSYRYSYESVISTIGVAISSHNRDGDYPEYREIIVIQLEQLKSHGDLEKAQGDPSFKPLYHIATDFTWHENYGFRADIARPECYIDLAELFVSWGCDDVNYRDPETGHSPLSAAVKRGHHPGIATYVRWLLDRGADLRGSDPDDLNPRAIAKEKRFAEIRLLLEKHAS